MSSPIPLSAAVSVRPCRTSICPWSFPPASRSSWRPPFLLRVPSGGFPAFIGTIRALRLPGAHPAALRCLRLAVPSVRPVFATRRPGERDVFSEDLVRPAPPDIPAHFSKGDTGTSQVPGESSRACPVLMTPAGFPRQAGTALRCCLPPYPRRRPPRCMHFGALSQGLPVRCLRFAARVTPTPRKTRFRLAANLGRAGLDTCGTPNEVSRFCVRRLLSFPLPLNQAWPGARRVALGDCSPRAPTDPDVRD